MSVSKALSDKLVTLAIKHVDEIIDTISRELIQSGALNNIPIDKMEYFYTTLMTAYKRAIDLDWKERVKFANNMNDNMTDEQVKEYVTSNPDMQKWLRDMGII